MTHTFKSRDYRKATIEQKILFTRTMSKIKLTKKPDFDSDYFRIWSDNISRGP